jgi:hypothetical protein
MIPSNSGLLDFRYRLCFLRVDIVPSSEQAEDDTKAASSDSDRKGDLNSPRIRTQTPSNSAPVY